MSPATLTVAMFGSLIVCLFIGVPLFGAIGAAAIIFGLIVGGTDILQLYAMRIFTLMTSYSLAAVPLFILMANLLHMGGIVEELFAAVYAWAGRIKGSILFATILAGVILSAMIGVVGASVITLGLIALPAMAEYRYNRKLALGTVCAAGTLGILIPPSIMPIFYSTVTATSVVDLFAASILPGLMLASLFAVYVSVCLIRRPDYAPVRSEAVPLGEKLSMLKGLIAPMVIIIVILGVILAGIASPTEAAGVGAFAVMMTLQIRKKLTFTIVKKALISTATATGMALWITFGASCFIATYALGGGNEFATTLMTSIPGGRWAVLIIIQVIYIIMGMFVDWIGICLLFVPVFSPVLESLGFDRLWIGLLFLMNMQISFLTPPFGYALFFVKGITPKDVTTAEIWRGSIPFLVCQAIALVICILFPQLGLWLPEVLH